jgi:hypothetical protein
VQDSKEEVTELTPPSSPDLDIIVLHSDEEIESTPPNSPEPPQLTRAPIPSKTIKRFRKLNVNLDQMPQIVHYVDISNEESNCGERTLIAAPTTPPTKRIKVSQVHGTVTWERGKLHKLKEELKLFLKVQSLKWNNLVDGGKKISAVLCRRKMKLPIKRRI